MKSKNIACCAKANGEVFVSVTFLIFRNIIISCIGKVDKRLDVIIFVKAFK